MLDPDIRSDYRPRDSWGRLARQYFRYGWGKADMLYANGVLPSLRPLAPLALLLGLTAGTILAALTPERWPLIALLVIWTAALSSIGLATSGGLSHRLRTMAATALMQLSYGVGLLAGLARGPGPRRHLRNQS